MPKWQPGESQEFMIFNRKSSSLFTRNNQYNNIPYLSVIGSVLFGTPSGGRATNVGLREPRREMKILKKYYFSEEYRAAN